jgi:hypothetical protein
MGQKLPIAIKLEPIEFLVDMKFLGTGKQGARYKRLRARKKQKSLFPALKFFLK